MKIRCIACDGTRGVPSSSPPAEIKSSLSVCRTAPLSLTRGEIITLISSPPRVRVSVYVFHLQLFISLFRKLKQLPSTSAESEPRAARALQQQRNYVLCASLGPRGSAGRQQ